MSGQDHSAGLSRIERLAALLREDASDIDAMGQEQLTSYLKENKVDITKAQTCFNAILKKANARRKLELARQRRLDAVERAKGILSAGSGAVTAVRERVSAMIERFKQHDPDQAQVYAREFEKATPEDLVILEEDLALLEMEDPKNGKGNQQDAR